MIKNGIPLLIVLLCIFLLCAAPATAAINTIKQGNAVFLGEEGLDVSAAMGPDIQIGWWASAAEIATTSPTNAIDLQGRTTSFMVNPSEFDGYLGNWYRLNSGGKADGIAFNVVDPQLDIKAEDTTVQVDVETLKWIPTGDDIRFKIDTNLVQMASQRASPPLITIKVQGPDGGIYTSLYNAGGTPMSIVEIPVTTRPFYTDSIWNMGNRDRYPPGTYTIWAECNVNKMNDNYDVTGKTRSSTISLLNQGENPLIQKATTQGTTQSSLPTTITATPEATAATQAPISTTVPTITTVTSLTTAVTEIPSPSPTQTKAAGFEPILAVSAIISGFICYLKKK